MDYNGAITLNGAQSEGYQTCKAASSDQLTNKRNKKKREER